MRLMRTGLGLTLLFLTLCLTACSVTPLMPPTNLLADCTHAPAPTARTNGALAGAVQAERAALDRCNADKASLRAYYNVE